jgi:hypothetical protein
MTETQHVEVWRDGAVIDHLHPEDARLLARCGHGLLVPVEDGGLVLVLPACDDEEGECDDEDVCDA